MTYNDFTVFWHYTASFLKVSIKQTAKTGCPSPAAHTQTAEGKILVMLRPSDHVLHRQPPGALKREKDAFSTPLHGSQARALPQRTTLYTSALALHEILLWTVWAGLVVGLFHSTAITQSRPNRSETLALFVSKTVVWKRNKPCLRFKRSVPVCQIAMMLH